MASLAEPLPEQAIAIENPSRVVWTLAWPAVALNSLQVLNTLLDRGFIGRLPTSALTSRGGSMTVLLLMFSLAMALATGATAPVARSYGANETPHCRIASRQPVSLTVFAGFVMAAITAVVAPF